MSKTDPSKRTFVKRAAAAIGFFAAADYMSKLLLSRSNSIQDINNRSDIDVNKQKQLLLQSKMVLMTDDDKKQMLDAILDIHSKHKA